MALENNAGVVIYQGEDKPITIRLADQDGDPINLTNASEIKVILATTSGTPLVKTMSNSGGVVPLNAGGGIFQVTIAAADSIGLLVGDNQSIEIRVTIQGVLTIAQVQNAISVLPSLFPGV